MKIVSNKSNFLRVFAIAAAGILIALSIGMHGLHNHDADGEEHHDCPVHKYELVLGSSLSLLLTDIPFNNDFILVNTIPMSDRQYSSVSLQVRRSRAPPL